MAKKKTKAADADGEVAASDAAPAAEAKKGGKKAKAADGGAKKPGGRRKKAEPGTRGLAAVELAEGNPPAEVQALTASVAADGGRVLASYRDPLGGIWQLFVALPLDKVQPAPFQRDLSETHVKKLGQVMDRLERYLDPILVVRTQDGSYWTPNGHHRLAALRGLGARTITALLIPEFQVAYQILALNTEKSPNLKERALEVIRLARALADLGPEQETDYAVQLEEANLLTLGCCYEQQPRFSGSVYQSLLRRCDELIARPLKETLPIRAQRAAKVFEIDALVAEKVKALKERGLESPYLKNFVVARITPFAKGARGNQGDFDTTMAEVLAKARAFDPAGVDPAAVKGGGGPPPGGEEGGD